MSGSAEGRLYDLLPAVYRVRDAAQGEPLRALCAVIERELSAVDADIDALYDNWFIETCDEWVVPYIGDLLGVRLLHQLGAGAVSQRAYVANTLAYRRRKGTAAVLEQLARDVTGWPARAVEFFQLLATNQHLNHLRPGNLRTPDLRDADALELLGGPFESAARTVEVRRIVNRRGRYNIPNIGLFLWRLQSYPMVPTGSTPSEEARPGRADARAVADPPDGRYTFDPLGYDTPLYNRPQTEETITHLAEEINVPAPLRRRALHHELEARRQPEAGEEGERRAQYFGANPVLEVYVDGGPEPVPPQKIHICDLENWHLPPPVSEAPAADGEIAVDPARGRLALAPGAAPESVLVSYCYGFSADVGGGPYNRRESVDAVGIPPGCWQMVVTKEPIAGDGEDVCGTLAEAVGRWNEQPAGTVGVIAVLDSRTYEEDLTGDKTISVKPDSRLLIVAADWPKVPDPSSPGAELRLPQHLVPDGRRPHLRGSLSVKGTSEAGAGGGELALDGLLIEGELTVLGGDLAGLRLAHCTLVPEKGGLTAETVDGATTPKGRNENLRVEIVRSICGPIRLPKTVPALRIEDSIVDADGGEAIIAPGAAVDVQKSTVFGTSEARSLEAGNSIFTGTLNVTRRQVGCVRFCWVPSASSENRSRTPRRYACQPDLAIKGISDSAAKAAIEMRLTPAFESPRYGDPAYAQLSMACAEEIRTGAENGAEMGVFSHLMQPQREANLRASLDEYLRFGLEAGIFYVT